MLFTTCENDEDLEDCECIFAEELEDLGLLSCSDAASCPSACPICSACMQLMGCTRVTTGISSDDRTSNTVYVVAAALGLIVFGLVYFTARRQRDDGSELQAHLMADDQQDSSTPPPVAPAAAPTESSVWLAPDTPPVQFEPSARAAVGLPVHIPEDMMMEPMSILSSRPTFAAQPDDQVWLAPIT